MADQKEQLVKALGEFDARHDEFIRKFSFSIGKLQRFTGRTSVGRWILKNVTTRIAAWALVKFHVLSMRRPENPTAVNIAYEWQKLALFMRVPVQIESADDDKVVIIHPECSVGFKPGEDKVCRASMNMDHYLVKALGGKLTTTETLSSGGKYCRHILEPL